MKKAAITLALSILISLPGKSQGFQSFINYLNSLPEDQRTAKVDSFMAVAAIQGFPYITVDTANFIYRGNQSLVQVASDFNGWDPGSSSLTKVTGTDFFYLSKTFEMNARLDYKYVLGGSNWILDPLNPHTCSGGFGPNSELAMPGYVQPWEINTYANVAHGAIQAKSIASTYVGNTFQLKIYLPAGYDESLPGGYPTVYFQDGYEYISLGFADRVLDNLIDSGLCCPVIGVFVRPNNRNDEYAGNLRNAYQQFFATELVPYIDGAYNTIKEARARAVIGDSYGGNISALISYNHADLFANCGLHSAAFQPNNYEAYNLVINGEAKPIRWASVWGTYEPLWDNMRDFRDFLIQAGYDMTWLELPEGHSWGQWRATIDMMVPYFFPPGFLATADLVKPDPSQIHVFPNPARENLHITFNLTEPATAIIRIYSGSGMMVLERSESLNNAEQCAEYPLSGFSAGVYYLSIDTGGQTLSEKIVITN